MVEQLASVLTDGKDLGYESFTHCQLYLGSVAEPLASVLTDGYDLGYESFTHCLL